MGLHSDLNIKIVRRIEDIPSQDWNRVFPQVVENYNFFRALDDSHFPEFSFFYILIYEDDIPIGAASCFLMHFPLDFAVNGPLKNVMDFLKRSVPSIFNPKVLICGLPMGQGRIGALKNPAYVLKSLTRAMEQIAREEKASIIAFKDFNREYKDILDAHLDSGFFRIDSFPSTEMRISFKDFEGYLELLSSVSRSGLKRKLKKADQKEKIELEITGRLDEKTLEEAYALYLQTYHKNGMSLEKLTPDFFRTMSEHMPGETKFFLWRINQKLTAFAFCLVSGGYFIDYYLGFDYALAYDYHLYDVRFRDLMKWCIENKVKTYEMGPTTYEPKRRLGFNFICLYIYAKHCNRFFNLIFRVFCYFVQPSHFDPVFKDLKNANAGVSG